MVLCQGFGMNMTYTQMLFAAELEAPLFGSPHTDRYLVCAENETFMVTRRNTRLSDQVDMDIPGSSNYLEQDDTSYWDNNMIDSREANLSLQDKIWNDGMPAAGADLL
ncbi:hypothetical protein VPH35_015686 [Triticum aestivum]|uniref:Uncharacterized protein n=1 Tax=Aegilops tauschii subsp. strangulata TaxID=200361 RepID=A0A452ZAA8_AEGTS